MGQFHHVPNLADSKLTQVKQCAAPVFTHNLLEETPKANNQGGNSSLLPLVNFTLIQVNRRTTLTAREFRRRRGKQGFHVSQSDGHILALLTAFCSQHTTSNLVSKSGQEMGSTAPKAPHHTQTKSPWR